MLSKVYISDEISDSIFEAKLEFSAACKVLDCTEMSLANFARLQSPNLFKSTLPTVFFNVESLGSEPILSVLNTPKLCTGIWCFSKLTKESKVYKKLKTIASVETVKPLNTKLSRKKFINKVAPNLPESLVDRIAEVSSVSRGFLQLESDKISKIYKVLGELPAIRSICNMSHESGNIFALIDLVVYKKTSEFYERLPSTVSFENPMGFKACILKRLSAMLLMSEGHPQLASEFWRYFGEALYSEQKVVKSLGSANIRKLSDLVEREFDLFKMWEPQNVVKAYTSLMYCRDKMP